MRYILEYSEKQECFHIRAWDETHPYNGYDPVYRSFERDDCKDFIKLVRECYNEPTILEIRSLAKAKPIIDIYNATYPRFPLKKDRMLSVVIAVKASSFRKAYDLMLGCCNRYKDFHDAIFEFVMCSPPSPFKQKI